MESRRNVLLLEHHMPISARLALLLREGGCKMRVVDCPVSRRIAADSLLLEPGANAFSAEEVTHQLCGC